MFDFITFHGRANRRAYLVGLVAPAVITVVIATIGSLPAMVWPLRGVFWGIAGWVCAASLLVFLMWTWLAATVRRIRDIGLPVIASTIVLLAPGLLQRPFLDLLKTGFHTGHPIAAAPWIICELVSAIAWSVVFLWPGKTRPVLSAENLDDVFGADPAPDVRDAMPRRAQFGLRPQRLA